MTMLCTVRGCRSKQGIHVAHSSNARVNFQNNHNKKWVLCLTAFVWAHMKTWTSHAKQGSEGIPVKPQNASQIGQNPVYHQIICQYWVQSWSTTFRGLNFHDWDRTEKTRGRTLAFLSVPHWILSPFESSCYSLKAVFVGSAGENLRREENGEDDSWSSSSPGSLGDFARCFFKHQINHCGSTRRSASTGSGRLPADCVSAWGCSGAPGANRPSAHLKRSAGFKSI